MVLMGIQHLAAWSDIAQLVHSTSYCTRQYTSLLGPARTADPVTVSPRCVIIKVRAPTVAAPLGLPAAFSNVPDPSATPFMTSWCDTRWSGKQTTRHRRYHLADG